MNKKLIAVLLISVSVLVSGCSSGNQGKKSAENKQTNTKEVSPQIESSNDSSGAEKGNVHSQNDYSKYSGSWVQEQNLKNDFKYGISVSLKVDKDGNLQGQVGSSTENATHVSNVDIKGRISGNRFISNFNEDGWGHKGTIELEFQGNTVILKSKYSNDSAEDASWGIGEGTFNLVNSNSNITRTLKDLKSGGLQVIEEQCFNVKLQSYGNVKFISGVKREDGNTVQFYLVDKNENVLYKFPNFYGNEKGMFKNISAVSFTDVNGDGLKDVVIAAKYSNGASDSVSIGSIYFAEGKGFASDKKFDDKLNNSSSDSSIASIISYYKQSR